MGPAAVQAIFRETPDRPLPVILVAHDEREPLGTIALREYVADDAMPESPWVRQLYVFPRHRGRGIDRLLIGAIESAARQRGFATLYAATNRIEKLLLRRGWTLLRRVEHEGEPMAWLARKLSR